MAFVKGGHGEQVEKYNTSDIKESEKLQKLGVPLIGIVCRKGKPDPDGTPHYVSTYTFVTTRDKVNKLLGKEGSNDK